ETAAQEQVASLTALLEELRQRRDTATADLNESKVSLASEEQLFVSFRQQTQNLEQRIRELGQIVELRRAECSSFLGRREQAESEIQESRGKIERLQHDREQVNAQVVELLSQKQAQELDVAAREEALREQRRHLSEIQQQRGTIEIELAQKNMSVQNLRERIQQKYHVNIDDVRSE